MNRLSTYIAEALSSAIDGVITALFLIAVFQLMRVSVYFEPYISNYHLKQYLAQKLDLNENSGWAEIDEVIDQRSLSTLHKKLKLKERKSFSELSVIQETSWPATKHLDQT